MKFVKGLLLLAIMCVFLKTQAQDIHFTQFYMSPLTLNPAQTGAFEGTLRIGGIYRDQWNYLAGIRGFRTPSFYVDAPLFRGLGKRDWIGAGINIYQDKAGRASLSNGSLLGSVAYHLSLSKKGGTTLAFGLQGGFVSRRISDKDKLTLEDQFINNTPQSQELASIGQSNVSYFDLNAGVNLNAALNKKMGINIGFSMAHLTQPKYNLINSPIAKLPVRFAGHGQFNIGLDDKWTLSPAFLFQSMAGANEIAIQAMTSRLLNKEKEISLRGGLGYRLRDALEILLGIDYGQLRVGAAYDLNISDLKTATNYHGGFEIAASYIVKIYKKPEVKPVLLCPRF